jgi:F420-non-reducing hydrogenase small subunit
MTRPKIAVAWNSSCGGCDESIVDIEEKILDIASQVEFVLWPCAMDFKYDDVRKLKDKSITASLINGGIQNSEQEEVVTLLREKSQYIVAFGSCAWLGGVPSLINLKSRKGMFDVNYISSPTLVNSEKTLPEEESKVEGHTLTLPRIYETLYRLDDIIDVDYYLPGCPPSTDLIISAITAIIEGNLPEKGAVLAPDKNLCATCTRNGSKPEDMSLDEIKRIHQVQADPEICFLAQKILCMGPATRDGCGQPCINGNMPCTGCFGPVEGTDQGAKMISALGGVIEGETGDDVERVTDGIVDPAGTFYRYSTASSLLGRKRKGDN